MTIVDEHVMHASRPSARASPPTSRNGPRSSPLPMGPLPRTDGFGNGIVEMAAWRDFVCPPDTRPGGSEMRTDPDEPAVHYTHVDGSPGHDRQVGPSTPDRRDHLMSAPHTHGWLGMAVVGDSRGGTSSRPTSSASSPGAPSPASQPRPTPHNDHHRHRGIAFMTETARHRRDHGPAPSPPRGSEPTPLGGPQERSVDPATSTGSTRVRGRPDSPPRSTTSCPRNYGSQNRAATRPIPHFAIAAARLHSGTPPEYLPLTPTASRSRWAPPSAASPTPRPRSSTS